VRDLGTIPKTDSPERDAIAALVRRIQHDADVAFLIGPMTETYELLLRAVQHIHSIDVTQARTMLRRRTTERPRIATQRARIEILEETLDARCPGWRDEPASGDADDDGVDDE